MNLGLLKAVRGDYAGAAEALDITIEAMSIRLGQFSQHLYEPLMARGRVYEASEMYESAEDDLRWAQNIIHRHEGVYSTEQLPVVKELALVQFQQAEYLQADREQRFNLKINERAHGVESELLLPVLQNLAAYFATRGDMIPMGAYSDNASYRDELFDLSVSLYERAIRIIENQYGENDLRLVEPLRGLAEARILEISARHRAEEAMERAADIVGENEGTDLPDHVRALVHLADTYVITGDNRAEETYLKAWNMLAGEPGYNGLRNELFGTPKRLHPETPGVIVIDHYPQGIEQEKADLYVNAKYTVRANGRVSDVEIIDGNVPNEEKRSVRYHLAEARFRPRIVNGEFQATEGLMLHQPFMVKKPEPVNEISISSGSRF